MEHRSECLFVIAVGWLKDGEVECRCSDGHCVLGIHGVSLRRIGRPVVVFMDVLDSNQSNLPVHADVFDAAAIVIVVSGRGGGDRGMPYRTIL